MSKVTEVATYMANNPNATAKDVMKKFKASKPYAYKLMTEARKQYLNRRDEALAKPKQRMQSSESWKLIGVSTSGQSLLAGGPTEAELNGTASALDVQVGGGHYKDMVIQPVEFITKNNLGFLEGCIVKRISRWRSKDGIKDLEKIKHEIDLLIELNGLK